MRGFVIIALTVLSLIGCSHSPTQPTTSPATQSTTSTAANSPPNILTGSNAVSGILSDGTNGQPIAGANVSAWVDTGNSGGYAYMWAHGPLFTDASGHYQLTALPASATVRVEVWKTGYVQQCAAPAMTMQGDARVDTQLVSLANLSSSPSSMAVSAPGYRSVSGTIFQTTPTGQQPAVHAFVDFEPFPDVVAAVTYSDMAGHYLLCGLPDGQSVSIGTSLDNHIAYMSVTPGRTTGVDITLP